MKYITINNWTDRRKRKNVQTMTWFAVRTDIASDPRLFDLDPSQKWFFIWLTALASETCPTDGEVKNKIKFFSHESGVSEEEIKEALTILIEEGLIVTSNESVLHQVVEIKKANDAVTNPNESVRDANELVTDSFPTGQDSTIQNNTGQNKQTSACAEESPAEVSSVSSSDKPTPQRISQAYNEILAGTGSIKPTKFFDFSPRDLDEFLGKADRSGKRSGGSLSALKTLKDWRGYFELVKTQKKLTGQDEKFQFCVTLGWLLKLSSVHDIFNGKYQTLQLVESSAVSEEECEELVQKVVDTVNRCGQYETQKAREIVGLEGHILIESAGGIMKILNATEYEFKGIKKKMVSQARKVIAERRVS